MFLGFMVSGFESLKGFVVYHIRLMVEGLRLRA